MRNPIEGYQIKGNWKGGWALDEHTISSYPSGDGSFVTDYTKIGKALSRLKYREDYSQIDFLVSETIVFLKTRLVTRYLDVIIPVSASKIRRLQPVEVIAKQVSDLSGIPIDKEYLLKIKNTGEVKSIDDKTIKEQILKDAFGIQDLRYQNRKIMLFDDIYSSGSTLNEITNTLYNVGKVQNVYVITLTKTRVKM